MGGAQLIVFGGLPGTGKTTLARAVAREMRAVYLDRNTIKEETIGIAREMKVEGGGLFASNLSYALLFALARDNLTVGMPVVLDSPAGHKAFQDRVEDLVHETKVALRLIECITTDENLLRQRIESRGEDMGEQRPRDEEALQQARARLERLSGPRLVVDTAEAVAVNLQRVLKHLGSGHQSE